MSVDEQPRIDDHEDDPSERENTALRHGLGLCPTEFSRFTRLDMLKQSTITNLLKERTLLNNFVRQHLEEKITPKMQFSTLIQILFPTEHALRYALKKVDDIESDINRHLENTVAVFDKKTTKRNRIQMMLDVAIDYKNTLIPNGIGYAQKTKDISLIIDELTEQINTSKFSIHRKDILKITDPELSYFLSKLTIIGITGMSGKQETSIFKVRSISAFFERFYSDQPKDHDDDSDNRPKF